MILTSSALDRVDKCPASASMPAVHSTSEAAESGTEKHEDCADVLEGRRALAELSDESVRVYETVEPYIQGMRAERALVINLNDRTVRHIGYRVGRNYGPVADHELPVTLDFSNATGDLIELKTGHMEVALPAYNLQIQAQSYALATIEGLSSVRARLAQIPEGKAPFVSEPQEFGPLDVGEILLSLRDVHRRAVWARLLLSRGERPPLNEGAWCKYCPARLECPAKTSLIRAAVGGDVVGQISRENVADLYLKLQRAKEVIGAAEAQIYAMAAEEPIALGGGYALGEIEVPSSEKVDPGVAWSVFRETFGEEVAKRVVKFSVTKTAISDVIAQMFAEYGASSPLLGESKTKTAAQKWINEQIRELGGFSRPPPRFEVKKYKRGEVAEEVES